MEKPSYYGHRKRVKQKFKETGFNGWHDYEVLELALTYAIPLRDTKPIAKELIKRFKTLDGVLNADPKEIMTIRGVSEHAALFIRLLKDVAIKMLEMKTYQVDMIDAPEAAYAYLTVWLGKKPDEEFVALFLNKQNVVTAVESLQKGTVDEAIIYPRKVVERALYHHATGVIIAHNHPGGSLQPSANDIKMTRAIKQALEIVDVSLHDHILVSKTGFYSWKSNKVL